MKLELTEKLHSKLLVLGTVCSVTCCAEVSNVYQSSNAMAWQVLTISEMLRRLTISGMIS